MKTFTSKIIHSAGAVICLATITATLTSCAAVPPKWTPENARPTQWAQQLDRQGLPNFHRVADNLYRGAQPDPVAFGKLKTLGVRTVINLRSEHENRVACETDGLCYVHIPQRGWAIGDSDALAFLKVATDPANGPMFVHCRHGADRTGTMVAVYRVVVEGWSKADAIDEMIRGGFGYHMVFRNLISYIQGIDVDSLRREAGLTR